MPTNSLDPLQQTFKCPNCNALISEQATDCPNCHMNLALAAVMRERQVLALLPALPDAPYVTDLILPRFGYFLLNSGYITEHVLQSALIKQRALAIGGQQQTLGQILFSMGIVTREQLDLASIQQVKQLQDTLQENNRQLEERVAQRTQELQQVLGQLNELNRLKTNFVANITHELRTPLSNIKISCSLLQNELGTLNADQNEAVQIMLRAAEQLRNLIEDLLSYASTAQGKMLINPTAFSLVALTAAVLASPSITTARTKINLQAQVASTLPLALADEEKIGWVIAQLLDNAIKFTPEGGMVTLIIEPEGNRLRVSIRDTGIGIPPERIGELFEPFHQLDGTSSRSFGGTGLGLALVKRIVEAHGSTVTVESQPGSGSIFSFDMAIAMS